MDARAAAAAAAQRRVRRAAGLLRDAGRDLAALTADDLPVVGTVTAHDAETVAAARDLVSLGVARHTPAQPPTAPLSGAKEQHMAPRTTTPEADGAKPGAEEAGAQLANAAYDADARARHREAAPITIDGEQFFRRRKNWETTRALRRLLRKQEKAYGLVERLRVKIDGHHEQLRGVRDYETGEWKSPPVFDQNEVLDIEAAIEALQDQIDPAQDEAEKGAFEIIALLLRDERGEKPPLRTLQTALDVQEAVELAAMLANGIEPTPDPTTTATSSA